MRTPEEARRPSEETKQDAATVLSELPSAGAAVDVRRPMMALRGGRAAVSCADAN